LLAKVEHLPGSQDLCGAVLFLLGLETQNEINQSLAGAIRPAVDSLSQKARESASSKLPSLLASPCYRQLAKVLAAVSKVLLNKRVLKTVLGTGRFRS
jgi:hypothetical protein